MNGFRILAAAVTLLGLAAAPAMASPGFVVKPQSQSANISELGGEKGGALESCSQEIGKYCIGKEGGARTCLSSMADRLSGQCKAALEAPPPAREVKNPVPRCARSPLCSTNRGGGKPVVQRVLWNQTLGYGFAYPFALPPAAKGGVSGVAVDSKDNL